MLPLSALQTPQALPTSKLSSDNVLATHVQRCYFPSMLAIRLSPEIENRLERLAKMTGRTKTFYAREAIRHTLSA